MRSILTRFPNMIHRSFVDRIRKAECYCVKTNSFLIGTKIFLASVASFAARTFQISFFEMTSIEAYLGFLAQGNGMSLAKDVLYKERSTGVYRKKRQNKNRKSQEISF
jgi:hypothetical protein